MSHHSEDDGLGSFSVAPSVADKIKALKTKPKSPLPDNRVVQKPKVAAPKAATAAVLDTKDVDLAPEVVEDKSVPVPVPGSDEKVEVKEPQPQPQPQPQPRPQNKDADHAMSSSAPPPANEEAPVEMRAPRPRAPGTKGSHGPTRLLPKRHQHNKNKGYRPRFGHATLTKMARRGGALTMKKASIDALGWIIVDEIGQLVKKAVWITRYNKRIRMTVADLNRGASVLGRVIYPCKRT